MKKLSFLSIITILLTSCGSINDAGKVLRNEKIKTTDEFLVKKRNPLVLPPNYEKIPEPGSTTQKKNVNEENIKKILKAPVDEEKLKTKPTSVEDSILKKIRK